MIHSLDIVEATGGNLPSRLSESSREQGAACVSCRVRIIDNHWFCRLPQNGNGFLDSENLRLVLCSPRCAIKYFKGLRPARNGYDEELERTIAFLIGDEKPLWL